MSGIEATLSLVRFGPSKIEGDSVFSVLFLNLTFTVLLMFDALVVNFLSRVKGNIEDGFG